MVANTNDLIGGLHVARSAAIRNGSRVTICKSSNAGDANPTCDTGANWEDGWFVFVEGTNPGNLIGTFNSNDGDILRVNTGAEGSDTTITASATDIQNFVSFSSRGLPTKSNGVSVSGTFRICDERGLTNASGNVVARGIVLLASGRAGSSKESSVIGSCP